MVKIKVKSQHSLTRKIIKSLKYCWLKLVLPCLQYISRIISRLRRIIIREKQFSLVFFFTLALTISLIIFGILPASQNFEGNLLVSSLSFTSTESDKLLLKDVSNFQEITISGSQKLTLSDTFTNASNPEIAKQQQLEIELPNENSYLKITPSADFSLKELRLQENTRIENLNYDSYNHHLAFTIKPSNPSQSPIFTFTPSFESFKITLSDYKIPKLSLSSSDTPLEFSLQTTEFELQPTTTIDVNLSQLPEAKPKVNPPEFWGSINVSDVTFKKLIKKGDNVNDEYPDSTILSGDIRMAKQELKLEAKQFLIIENPGIETLNRIQIVQPDAAETLELKTTAGDKIKLSEASKGLEVSISGNTNSIKIGLNPKLPIAQIQGSLLSRHVSNDVMIAIISLTAGLIASLIAWLFNNFPDSPKAKN